MVPACISAFIIYLANRVNTEYWAFKNTTVFCDYPRLNNSLQDFPNTFALGDHFLKSGISISVLILLKYTTHQGPKGH